MMDILIKSFNRPYYLDRCLYSIHKNIKSDFKITIMDDGTPQQYLLKIQQLYPHVKILLSDNYQTKSNLVQSLNVLKNEQNIIPVKFWINSVEQSSETFLMLEEDSWITEPIDLTSIIPVFTKNNFNIVKLSWNGNDQTISGNKLMFNSIVEKIIPSLPQINKVIVSSLLKNSFKLRTILFKLRLLSIHFFLPYYSLYTVTSALFNKKYWLHLWNNSQQHVDEYLQLDRALEWSNQSGGLFGKYHKEIIKTSFLTSSNNSAIVKDFNMNSINHFLNSAWFNNRLDITMNYPHDFKFEYLKSILTHEGASNELIKKWESWIEWFTEMHKSVGNKID